VRPKPETSINAGTIPSATTTSTDFTNQNPPSCLEYNLTFTRTSDRERHAKKNKVGARIMGSKSQDASLSQATAKISWLPICGAATRA